MYTLLIETSTNRGSAAIGRDGQVIRSIELSGSRDVAKNAHDLCQKAGIRFQELGLCIVGIGPGSYTGIRVAVSFAKGIAVALKIPLIPMSSLYGLVPEADGTFMAAIDAKVGGVFVAQGRKKGLDVSWEKGPERIDDGAFSQRADLVDYVVTIERSWITHKQLEFATPVITSCPQADVLIRQGWQQFQEGTSVLPKDLHPLYLRRTQAEIEKDS